MNIGKSYEAAYSILTRRHLGISMWGTPLGTPTIVFVFKRDLPIESNDIYESTTHTNAMTAVPIKQQALSRFVTSEAKVNLKP